MIANQVYIPEEKKAMGKLGLICIKIIIYDNMMIIVYDNMMIVVYDNMMIIIYLIVILYNQVYTPEEKKAMGKAIRFLADMDQSFNGRVRPRWSIIIIVTTKVVKKGGGCLFLWLP